MKRVQKKTKNRYSLATDPNNDQIIVPISAEEPVKTYDELPPSNRPEGYESERSESASIIIEKSPFLTEKALKKQKKMKHLTFEATNNSSTKGVLISILNFLRFVPALLGLVDEVTDFYYYFTEDFHSDILKQLCLFFLMLTPFIFIMLWLVLFIKVKYTGKQAHHWEQKYKLTRSFKNQIMIPISILLEIAYLALKYSIPAFCYCIMSEIKVLPIYFIYQQQKKTKYLVTEKILAQYIEKRPALQVHKTQNKVIDDRNRAIRQFNREVDEYNEQYAKKIKYYGHQKKEKLEEIPLKNNMDIQDTSDLKHLESLEYSDNVSFWDRINNDTTITNLLKSTDLIESTFESLPMLILQFINNHYQGKWSNIAIFSMTLSGTMALINAIEIGLSIFKQNILPQIHFYQTVEEENNKRADSIHWLFGDVPKEMHFYNEQSLIALSKMNHESLNKIDSLVLDFRSNPNLVKVLTSQIEAMFELIPIKLKKKHSLQIEFGQNYNITDTHCEALAKGLSLSDLHDFKLNIEYNDMISQKGLIPIVDSLQQMPNLKKFFLDISHTPLLNDSGSVFSSLMASISRVQSIEEIDLDFSGKQCLNQESFDSIQKLETCSNLLSIRLDLRRCTKIVNIKSLSFLKNCSQLEKIDFSFYGCNQLNDISDIDSIQNLEQLQELSLNFYWCSEIRDITCLDSIGNLKNLQSLYLNFDGCRGVKSQQFLEKLHQCTEMEQLILNFDYCNGIKDISYWTYIRNFQKLKKLEMHYSRCPGIKSIESISFIEELKLLEEVVLDFYFCGGIQEIRPLQQLTGDFKFMKKLIINLGRCDMVEDFENLGILGKCVADNFEINIENNPQLNDALLKTILMHFHSNMVKMPQDLLLKTENLEFKEEKDILDYIGLQ